MDQFRLFPPQASTTSHEVDALFFALTLISLFFMAVIFLPIIFFSVKYRRGSSADRSNPRSGSFLIESGWTIGPIFLSLGLFAWGAVAYFRIERRPENAIDVEVVGRQWMWKLQHAEGKREINEFHAPLLQGLYRNPVPLANGTMVTADDQYLRDSILQPGKQITAGYQNIMPSFAGHLSEEEIMQLIAYLKYIGNQPPPSQE